MEISCEYYEDILNSNTTRRINWKICSVMNLLLAFPTVVINISLIIAILTTTFRTNPCQKLLLNLAIIDVVTGVLVMPGFYLIFGDIPGSGAFCAIADSTFSLAFLLGSTSFLTIITISLERFTKVRYPYTYHQKFSLMKTRVLIFNTWFLPTVALAIYQLTRNKTFMYTAMLSPIAIGAVIVLYSYGSILMIAWTTRRQINAEAARYGNKGLSQGDRKLALIGGLIVVSMFLCYLPTLTRALGRLCNIKSLVLDDILGWKWTFLVGNSLLNPLISCVFNPTYKKRIAKIWTCKKCHGDDFVSNRTTTR